MTAATSAPQSAGAGRRPFRFVWASLAAVSAMVVSPAAQQPSFRSSVDVIAVDVQVVDGDGNPIDILSPEAFEVSIKGQRRRVVSADFVRYAWAPPATGGKAVAVPAGTAVPTSPGGRTMVLAIDVGSFEHGSEQPALDAARRFIDHLEPSDRLGLYAFPTGVWISPTTDRAPLRTAVGRLTGLREPLRNHYHLKPWEIVEITALSTNPNSFLTVSRRPDIQLDPATAQIFDAVLSVQARECPNDPDCPARIYGEGLILASQLEQQAQLSLSGLDDLLRGLEQIEGRKSVVVISGGLLVSDRPEGRPDVGDRARAMGQAAARSNAVVYTVHVDSTRFNSVASSRSGSISANIGRDRAMYGNWLEAFSDAAGGQRIYVPTGDGDFAFDRVLRESSGYYLLGVEPAQVDRDGQPRELTVKVNKKGLTVRSRQWVVVPKAPLGAASAASR